MDIAGINFRNEKGAIIVGTNMSGKSTILKRIFDQVQTKAPNKGKVLIDGTYVEVSFLDAESILDKSFEGKSALINSYGDKVLNEINASTPIASHSIFNSTNFVAYQTALNSSARSKDKANLLNTGVSINHSVSVRDHDLSSLSVTIDFNGSTFDLNTLSSGAKVIVSFFLNQLNDGATNKLFLLDEIEAFLHPEWLEVVAALINALILAGNKIVLVTHSPILLSGLSKINPDMLSFVRKGATVNDGTVETLDYDDLKNRVQARITQLDAIENPNSPTSFMQDYSDKFIKYLLNQETCMMFFWNKPIFVEGMSDKIYIEQRYKKNVINVGGFYQYLAINEILKSLDIVGKFIMDHDGPANSKIGQKNDLTYNDLIADGANVFRWVVDFENYVSNSKIHKKLKIKHAIDSVDSMPIDGSGEMQSFETFLNS